MAFVRAWWPPVVVGLMGALFGIGVAEVAGVSAGGAPLAASASARPASPRASIAPAAIERADEVGPSSETAAPARPKPKEEDDDEEEEEGEEEEGAEEDEEDEDDEDDEGEAAWSKPKPKPKPSTLVAVRPSQVLDLRRWKLTLPTGRAGNPTEYRQPELGSLDSGPFIRLTADRGVAFRAPVGGVTTENSSYPRSELREMSAVGRREAGWTNAAGRHAMTITQAITATPRVKPHVVAGQIHDAEDDVVMIRLEGRRLFVESDGDDVGLLDANYRLGMRFTVAIVATPRGIRITYNGLRSVDIHEVGRGWYFKAGCYPQSSPDRGDRPEAYGEVVIYALALSHT